MIYPSTFLIQENHHDEIQGSKFAQEIKIVQWVVVTAVAYLMRSNSKQNAKIEISITIF